MSSAGELRVLCVNGGSSSLKFSLFETGAAERLLLCGEAQRIGLSGASLEIRDASGNPLPAPTALLTDHRAALQSLLDWLGSQGLSDGLGAVGHRVVHGGARFTEARRVDPALLAELRRLVNLDPTHLPQEIAAIEAVTARLALVPQVVCFDTAFHRRMPAVAQRYALPRPLADEGVMRYGFHGLSYEFIVDELRRVGAGSVPQRLVIAHLGNGASMAAVRAGVGIETTMGFTPAGGLVMSTRAGDLDPGVVLYLLREKGLTADAYGDLINRQAGLLAVSGTSGDVRDLLAAEGNDARAAEALALFCYQAKKFIGALTAALGGLDALVFTGGIGEHAAVIRERICAGLEFLGVRLQRERNRESAPVISVDGGDVVVRVMRTNEELMIARHTRAIVAGPRPPAAV